MTTISCLFGTPEAQRKLREAFPYNTAKAGPEQQATESSATGCDESTSASGPATAGAAELVAEPWDGGHIDPGKQVIWRVCNGNTRHLLGARKSRTMKGQRLGGRVDPPR